MRLFLTAMLASMAAGSVCAQPGGWEISPEERAYRQCLVRESYLADDNVSPARTVAVAVRARCGDAFDDAVVRGLHDYQTDAGRQLFIDQLNQFARDGSLDMVLSARQWVAEHKGQLPPGLQPDTSSDAAPSDDQF